MVRKKTKELLGVNYYIFLALSMSFLLKDFDFV